MATSIRAGLGITESEIENAKLELQLAGVEEFQLPTTPDASPDTVPVQEIAVDAQQIQDSARNSLDFLAALAMPLVFQFCFPPVFISVWSWLTGYVHKQRDFSQLALGLPRGFAKSTVMKLFVLYCILFTKKKFIMVIAANQKLAENIISDIIDMLEEPNIRKVFGDWKLGIEKDTLGLKKFGFRGRTIILAAVGSETSVRGLNLKNERPDVMIFDDVQTRENADSGVQADALERWMIGTAMKTKSPFGCLFLFVGNMYPTKFSILRKLKSNPMWTKFIAGGILADGTSLWEDLHPIQQLIAEYDSDTAMGHPEIFCAEVLNDENASANNLIDFAKLPPNPFEDDDIPAGNFIMIDPSNDKLGSDAVSIGYFEIFDTKPALMELDEGQYSPGEIIKKALRMALTHNCRLIVVESNAFQYSLLYWFTFICEQLGITGIEAVPIYSGGSSKNSRILAMLKSYLAGEFYVHQSCKAQVHLQIMQWNALRRDNTDGILDLLTYANRIIELYAEFVVSLNVIQSQEFEALQVIEENTCF